MTEEEHAHYVSIAEAKGFTSFSEYVRSLCAKDDGAEEEARAVNTELRGIRIALEKIAGAQTPAQMEAEIAKAVSARHSPAKSA